MKCEQLIMRGVGILASTINWTLTRVNAGPHVFYSKLTKKTEQNPSARLMISIFGLTV